MPSEEKFHWMYWKHFKRVVKGLRLRDPWRHFFPLGLWIVKWLCFSCETRLRVLGFFMICELGLFSPHEWWNGYFIFRKHNLEPPFTTLFQGNTLNSIVDDNGTCMSAHSVNSNILILCFSCGTFCHLPLCQKSSTIKTSFAQCVDLCIFRSVISLHKPHAWDDYLPNAANDHLFSKK